MTKWSAWRSVLAGAVIGFVDVAGSEIQRRALRHPDAVVRFDDRKTPTLPPPRGFWFLAPLRDIRRFLHPN